MLEDPQSPSGTTGDEPAAPAKKAAASRARKTTAKKAVAKKTTKKVSAAPAADTVAADAPATVPGDTADAAPVKKTAARKTAAKKTTAKKTAAKKTTTKKAAAAAGDAPAGAGTDSGTEPAAAGVPAPVFQAPVATTTVTRRTRGSSTARSAAAGADAATEVAPEAPAPEAPAAEAPAAAKKTAARKTTAKKATGAAEPRDEGTEDHSDDRAGSDDPGDESGEGGSRRRRRRGGRRRRKAGEGGETDAQDSADADHDDDGDEEPAARPAARGGRGGSQGGRSGAKSDKPEKGDKGDKGGDRADQDDDESGDGSSRRRRRRRRTGEDGDEGGGDQQRTSTRARKSRTGEDQITAVSGSTRLEAKKQRRREGREAGRRRAPIVSEAEFLARREAVDRVMVIRQREDLIQIGVLEDKVLVEHYVARESQTSLIGNVYLGRVQNVLPSMEAAFIDIGKGRNAVLYAGEVNWSALGHKDGQPRKIESVLSSGQSVLVQVTKDPVGHKGARLTSQISLAGRFLVYVPDGTTSGISRKLPDTERNRLKTLLKEIVPDTAGVIVRTAAEGASEDELTRDVERLKARWEDIEKKSANKGAGAQLLYGEPDLTLKVVRDLFTEDFAKLVIQGDDAWDTVQGYVAHVAPDLEERLERFEPGSNGKDIFATYRVDEQIAKALDRKVWLPSGGSLVIDRTEAMTVVDVNTGKFTGSGGNLEETVTKNNLEAAEEVVRQLRLRDVGGIIVVDFIDMVLESNRDLVLRRLVECLGRDRTRHQVAEVTSLGLVQMTRKRIGTGLLEAFSENCPHCQGRGVVIHDAPVEPKGGDDDSRRGGGRRSRGGRGGDAGESGSGNGKPPTPKDVAKMAQAPKDEQPDRADTSEQADEPDEAPAERPADQPAEEAPAAAVEETPAEETPAEETPAEETTAEEAPAKGAEPEPEPEPVVEAPVEAAEAPAAASEPPRVVTRTRRRSARRPAGPPVSAAADLPAGAGSGAVGAPAATGLVEPGTASAEPGAAEPPQVSHVPIKKRGSRKR